MKTTDVPEYVYTQIAFIVIILGTISVCSITILVIKYLSVKYKIDSKNSIKYINTITPIWRFVLLIFGGVGLSYKFNNINLGASIVFHIIWALIMFMVCLPFMASLIFDKLFIGIFVIFVFIFEIGINIKVVNAYFLSLDVTQLMEEK